MQRYSGLSQPYTCLLDAKAVPRTAASSISLALSRPSIVEHEYDLDKLDAKNINVVSIGELN